jgi:hypothetical protein
VNLFLLSGVDFNPILCKLTQKLNSVFLPVKKLRQILT